MSRSIRAPRISLRTKLMLLAAALAAVPLPVTGLYLLNRAQEALAHQASELQLAIADDVASALERQLAESENGLDLVGRLLMDEGLPEDTAVTAAMRAVEGIDALDHVVIYDADGDLVDTIRETGSGHPPPPDSLAIAERARATERGFALGDLSEGDVGTRLVVIVPLRPEPAAAPSAYAVSAVSLERFTSHVEELAERRLASLDGTIIVVNERMEPVARGTGGRGAPIEDVDAHPLLAGVSQARFQTRFAQQSIYERGEERLGTLSSVPLRGWGVVVEVPTKVAFASIHSMQVLVLSTTAVVTLLALALGLWVSRSVTRPIAALVELSRKLGRRELGATVEVATTDELRTLGDALSAASLDLQESEDTIREEQAIRADLGRYLPGEIVDRIVTRDQDMALGGERRTITVLFADVVRFTPLTDEQEPEDVVGILNDLFTILTEIVFRHGGTVDKFIGDCVMAIWNAPSDQPDHAERALAAATEMHSWLETGNATWRERHGVELSLAIGVNTGEAIVGNVGSETRMTYTAIGDVVNVASRLEAIARPRQTLVTKETHDAAGDHFDYNDAGERTLAGRKEPVHLYEVRS